MVQHALLSQVLTPAEHRDSSSRNVLSSVLFPQFIQPSGSTATEVMTFSLPHYCLPWLPAVAHYLRQNLLIFLHVPKYTDSNTAHHFKVTAAAQQEGRRGGGVSAAATGCQTQLCLSVSRGLGGLVFSCCGCELLQHIAQMVSKLSNIGCILHDEHVHKALEVCRICSC